MSLTTMTAWERDPVSREPSIAGKFGQAWDIQYAQAAITRNIEKAKDSSIAGWIIEAPWAHGLWHSYWIVLLHLRPLPANPNEITFFLENATHEFWLYALHPDFPREEAIEQAKCKVLSPMAFGAQIIEQSDETAISRIRDAIKDVCDGVLSPDTDFRRLWIARFGDNMMK